VFLGPDNGVLASAVAMVGGADRAVALTNPEYQLVAPGATFAGRDVFAPAAAHLANGVPLDELGEAVDTNSLLPGVLPVMERRGDELKAEVLWVDRFGNAQLNVGPEDLDGMGEVVALRIGDRTRRARIVAAYGDIPRGEVGLVVDSYGLLAICIDRQSASAELDVDVAAQVTLEPSEDRGQVSPVTIGVKP
jgi:S-adenosylmethionine hydrolase